MDINHDQILEETRLKVLKLQEINETNQWALYSNKDGYVVYTKANPDNGINISRIQTEIAFKVSDVADVVFDVKKRHLYDEKVEAAHIVEEIDQNTRVIYVKTKPPAILMSSRDLVLLQRIYRNQDGSIYIVSKSIIHNKAPLVPKVERAEMAFSAWILTPSPSGVKIVALQCLDPKGDIPKAVVNEAAKFQTDMVKNLVKFIAKNAPK